MGGGGHIIILREREGGSELILTLLEGGTYLIFPLVKLILGPPLPDNYCTVPYRNFEFSGLYSGPGGRGGGGGEGGLPYKKGRDARRKFFN